MLEMTFFSDNYQLDWGGMDDFPVLTQAADESTRTPGLFICGPVVRHRTAIGTAILGFLYKSRMRIGMFMLTNGLHIAV